MSDYYSVEEDSIGKHAMHDRQLAEQAYLRLARAGAPSDPHRLALQL